MNISAPRPTRNRFFVLLLLTLTLVSSLLTVSAQAAPKQGNSLDWIPADASFYSAGFHFGEQYDLFVGSNAWKTLTNLGSVQAGWGTARAKLMEPGGPWDQYQQLLQDPDNKDLETLAKELLTTEVFVFGDKQFASTIDMLVTAFRGMQAANFVGGISAGIKGEPAITTPEELGTAFFYILNERLNDVVIPNTVTGFKIKSTEIAEKQLQRLELLITRVLAANAPPLVERMKRQKIAGGNFLSLQIEGDLIPWDQIPWAEMETEAGQFDKLRNKLRQLKLNVSLGVKDGYLLLCIGSSLDHLSKLGTAPLLIDTTELKPLQSHLSPALWSVMFQTKAMRQATAGLTKEVVQSYSDLLYALLLEAQLPEDLKERLNKDLSILTTDVKAMVPELGAQLGWSKRVPLGVESFAYDWSENLYQETSKPLDILQHVGGDPLLVLAGRGKYRPADYELVVKWAKTGYGYFEEYALPQAPEEERPKIEAVIKRVLPLVERFDNIVRTQILPACQDGQSALVLDRKIESKQWIGPMPPSEKPLPMLELAVVVGVSDADKLKAALGGLRGIADDGLMLVKELNPDQVPPDLQIPTPRTRPLGAGTVWWYDIPAEANEELKLDRQLLPHWGLVKNVGVIGTSPRQSAVIFSGAPFTANSYLKQSLEQPLAGVTSVQLDNLLQTFVPWIDYGFGIAQQEAQDFSQKALMATAQNDIKTVLRVIGCLKSYNSVTRAEGSALVTQGLLQIEDLK